MLQKYYHQVICFIACCVYLITAYNNDGYYHPDEHYQIIEFASMKMGNIPKENLAWEFHHQIRSTIQPSIAYIVFSSLKYIHINDVYAQVFVLRFITLILAVLCIYIFVETVMSQIHILYQKSFILLSYLLWFLPMLNTRFSSENWSGLLLLIAIIFTLSKNIADTKRYWLIGICLGLSFLFRFQVAFSIIGLFLWFIFIQKIHWKFLFQIIVSSSLIIILGICIDRWFYGNWVLTSWNYFHANIIENIASNYGTKAWYYYFIYILKFPSYPIGIFIFISILFLLYKQPKHVLIWCIIPFILGHSIIAHKEERFLFPLINFLPFILVFAFQEFIKWKKDISRKHENTFIKIIFSLLIFINIIGLTAMAFKAAGVGRMSISKYIHTHYKNQDIILYTTPYASAIDPWHGLPAKFYLDKNVEEISIPSLCALNDSIENVTTTYLVLIRKDIFKSKTCEFALGYLHYQKVKQSIPEWIQFLNSIYGGFSNDEILELYEKKK